MLSIPVLLEHEGEQALAREGFSLNKNVSKKKEMMESIC